MTMVAGSQSAGKKSSRNSSANNKNSSSSSGMTNGGVHCESESDTSISPSTEFSNMPTYRVPCKSSSSRAGDARGLYIPKHFDGGLQAERLHPCFISDMFRPDSSTESNNDQGSPVERARLNTPRHAGAGVMDKRGHRRSKAKDNQSLDRRKCSGSNNR